MPEIHVTDEQGTEHIFPDGSTPEMIAQALKVKPPSAQAQAAPSDDRNWFQKAVDDASTVTPQDEAGHGALVNTAQKVGAGVIGGILGPVAHPIQTMQSIGDVAKAYSNPVAGAEMGQRVINQVKQQSAQTAGALLGGAALGGVGGEAAEATGASRAAIADSVNGIRGYLRPTSSLSVVPRTEMAARNLASVILPEAKDATNYIKAAQEVPNVIQYAKQNGNPLNTQLEFSKAAQGYAKQMLDVKQQIEAPIQNKLIRTTGTGFGSRMGEGPDTFSTIGEIDKRITNINDQLRAPKLNTQDSRAALATETGLQTEASRLRDILHSELSKASGLTPDEVADIRQRAGRAFELANDTDAAVTKRMQEAGRADLRPIKTTELPSKALNFIRGNQVNVADRAFQRAIRGFPGQASPIPTPTVPPSAPASNTLDSLLQSSRNKRVDDLLSLKNLLRIQNMQ